MSEFVIKPATRQGVIPLIDLYSESGCGKTMSALLLARGLAGDGKIILIDTESRRGSLYADVIPGGFDALDFDAPFTPARYMAALQAAFAKQPALVVVDSMSHEWEGIGGVNDMASENEAGSGRPGLHNWRGPKMEHQKLVQFLLRSPVPLVCCIRAKYKTRQKKGTPEMVESGVIRKDQLGKTVIIKDAVTSPIQAEDFIFESTAHAEILPDHSIILTKCSHPALRECFPKTGPITIEHGQKIAAWCKALSAPVTTKQPEGVADLRSLKAQLWELTRPIHLCRRGDTDKAAQQSGVEKLNRWAIDENVWSDTEQWGGLTVERLPDIIDRARQKLEELKQRQEVGITP